MYIYPINKAGYTATKSRARVGSGSDEKKTNQAFGQEPLCKKQL